MSFLTYNIRSHNIYYKVLESLIRMSFKILLFHFNTFLLISLENYITSIANDSYCVPI